MSKSNWMRCPNCDAPVIGPDCVYCVGCGARELCDCGTEFERVDGFSESTGECQKCYALWRVRVDDDDAVIGWDEEFSDHGQQRCNGACGAISSLYGSPCSRLCPPREAE